MYVDSYDRLVQILEKEVISYKELQKIMNDELVSNVTQARPDSKHHNLLKYDIKLHNGELYFVYVKKSFFF